MSYNGYTATTLTALALGPGLLTVGPVTGATLLGVTDGGSQFDAGEVITTIPMDGVPEGVEGLEVVSAYNTSLGTVLKEWNNANLERLFGGTFSATAPTSTTPRILTLPDTSTFLQANRYIHDLRLWVSRGDTHWLAIHLFSARAQVGTLNTAGTTAINIPVSFLAKVRPNNNFSNLTSPPFEVEEYTAGPVIA